MKICVKNCAIDLIKNNLYPELNAISALSARLKFERFYIQSGSSSSLRRKLNRNCRPFSYWNAILEKKMKICLVLLALLVAVAFGHNKDGASYAAKKAAKLSFKVSLSLLIESLQ